MSSETGTDDNKNREALLAELHQLEAEIRRLLLTLAEHPLVSDEFKKSSRIEEWIK